jgi:hypothetical protein
MPCDDGVNLEEREQFHSRDRSDGERRIHAVEREAGIP